MDSTVEQKGTAERVAELVAQYDEKAAICMTVAREWLVSLHAADFDLIFDALRDRNLQTRK